jgi:hypothetical protein
VKTSFANTWIPRLDLEEDKFSATDEDYFNLDLQH